MVGAHANAYQGPKKQEKFEKLCKQLEGFDEGRHLIIDPDIDKSHHSAIHIIVDNKMHNYVTMWCCTMTLLCGQK